MAEDGDGKNGSNDGEEELTDDFVHKNRKS